jgi:hypothetical protein
MYYIFRGACQRKLLPLALTACLIFFVFSAGPGHAAGPGIQSHPAEQNTAKVFVEHSASDNATIYSISSGDCKIEWIARNAEIGVIKYWADCTLPLAEQLRLVEKICAEFFSKDKNAQAFRTLFWGGLEPDNENAPREMSLRLALAAHKSPAWDKKRGTARNGDINGFVKDLANSEMIYPLDSTIKCNTRL